MATRTKAPTAIPAISASDRPVLAWGVWGQVVKVTLSVVEPNVGVAQNTEPSSTTVVTEENCSPETTEVKRATINGVFTTTSLLDAYLSCRELP